MNHVQGEEEWDFRRAFFNGDFLQRVEFLRVVEPQDRTGPTPADDVFGLWPWDEIRAALVGLRVYLAATEGGIVYYQANFQPPLALVIGSEAQGASSQARRLATAQVRIPMPGGSESLNAAVAAGVLTFEVVRQRGVEDSASG